MDTRESADIEEFLLQVNSKGVRLWLEEGRLRFRAPKDALTPMELMRLRELKAEITALLQNGKPLRHRAAGANCAPLAYSQLQHWNFYQYPHHRALRHLCSVTHLRGQLDVDALRKSLDAVVQRQESLRTQFQVYDGAPVQEVLERGDRELRFVDLSHILPQSVDAEIDREIDASILTSIDVSSGPLFEIKLLRLGERDHVLIIATEHIISDMWSLNVLSRDLFQSYVQALTTHEPYLPELPINFGEYAASQRREQSEWLKRHGSYWNDRLAGFGRLTFPVDEIAPQECRAGWGMSPVNLGPRLTAELREWCRGKRTTVVLSMLTAYVALVLRWCKVSATVVRYEASGRDDPLVQDVIGYFTYPLYLLVALVNGDTFSDLLVRVTEEYCLATEHADRSYLEAQLPRPEFSRNTAFNWVPRGTAVFPPLLDGTALALQRSSRPVVNPFLKTLERDTEPFILFGEDCLAAPAAMGERNRNETIVSGRKEFGGIQLEAEEEIAGGVYFPQNRFSTATMAKFGRNFVRFVEVLARDPERRIATIAVEE